MKIFLVRHGESFANVKPSITLYYADHAIGLSARGLVEARNTGNFLAETLARESSNGERDSRVRLWVSPYRRTRETADEIESEICRVAPHLVLDRREHINLSEQQFGLFDGYTEEEQDEKFPKENAHYKKALEYEGRFWARMPQGESRYDVAVRVHQAFGTFIRDAERHNIKKIIVVTHGVTMRAFVMQWLHLPWEWMEKEPNPKNCAVRLIADGFDQGYIHTPNLIGISVHL